MKYKTKRQTFVFKYIWSNHPDGRNLQGWHEGIEPPAKYFSEIYRDYTPDDIELQKANSSGYYIYPDGAKIKVEEFGDISQPFGEYIRRIHMILPLD